MTEAKRLAPEVWRERTDGGVMLVAVRCIRCGTEYLPHVAVCPACLGEEFEAVELTSGRLYSYTVLHGTPPGFPSPLTIGYVDFATGVRAFGHIRTAGGTSPYAGMPVTIAADTVFETPDGTPARCYYFTNAEESRAGTTP